MTIGAFRSLAALPVIALLSVCPATQAQTGDPPPLSATAYPYVVGAGAIAGVALTQAVLFGAGGFPFFVYSAAASDATIAAEVSVGVSRLYAVTSAVIGGWVANWMYDRRQMGMKMPGPAAN